MSNKSIAVLGAGPAGLSAALWLRNLGFEPTVIESEVRAGGLQNLNFLANDWVLGQMRQTGPALAARFVEHARTAGVPMRTAVRLVAMEGHAGDFRLRFDDGDSLTCAAVVIATGTRYRAEEVLAAVDGIAALGHECIAYGPYAFADLPALAGKRVLIIGGGDNAFENARLLAIQAAAVHLVVRSEPRAQQGLADAIAAQCAAGKSQLWRHAMLRAVRKGADGIETLLAIGSREQRIVVDRIHVLAGYEPNTKFIAEAFPDNLRAGLRFDGLGYLTVDAAGRTGAPGVYAAGDVCNPAFPCVVSAIAQGAQVARTIEMDTRK